MTVRPARPDEIDAVLATYEWLFAPPGAMPPAWDPGKARERLAEAIESPDSVILVAEGGEGLIGLCSAYLDIDSVRFGRRCWVEDLAVHPERRSQGVGKALLAAARDWARERGAKRLGLESGMDRTDAHRFYEREGPTWKSRSYAWRL